MTLTYQAYARARDRRIIQRFGGGSTATLRKQNDIPATVAMQVVGVTAAGATQLTADANIKTKLGRAVKGSKFTIAGVAGTYTLTEAAESTIATIVLKFTPALPVGGAADNAVITWTQTYADWTFPYSLASRDDKTANATEKGTRVYNLQYVSGNEIPEVGDIFAGLPVIEVHPVGPGGPGTESRYRVTTGAKP